jgi:hypothetical protein
MVPFRFTPGIKTLGPWPMGFAMVLSRKHRYYDVPRAMASGLCHGVIQKAKVL